MDGICFEDTAGLEGPQKKTRRGASSQDQPLSPELKLIVTLCYLATWESYKSLQY